MQKILKKGINPESIEWFFNCHVCGTEFVASEKHVTVIATKELTIHSHCPCCSHLLKSTETYEAYKEKIK